MAPSIAITRNLTKEALGARVDAVAKDGLAAHNQQVLSVYSLSPYTTTHNILNMGFDWAWYAFPSIPNQKPNFVFLYGGIFTFEDCVQVTGEVEAFDVPEGCKGVWLTGKSRVLVIYGNVAIGEQQHELPGLRTLGLPMGEGVGKQVQQEGPGGK